MKRALTILAVCAGLSACGDDGWDTVAEYCDYGAVSEAQYEGCVDHVTYEDVVKAYEKGSEAAAYAIEKNPNLSKPDPQDP